MSYAINVDALTSQAQTIINKVLENRNQMIYAINPDGSFMEIQPGCTLLNSERFKMEVYVNTAERK